VGAGAVDGLFSGVRSRLSLRSVAPNPSGWQALVAKRPLENLSTALMVTIQLLLAAEELGDVRAATAHGALVLSSYDSLTLLEVGASEPLEVTLCDGHALDADAQALEQHLCEGASKTKRPLSTLDRLDGDEMHELADGYVRRYELCLALPLLAYGDLVGVLVFHFRECSALEGAEFDALRRFADCAAVALFNARARRDLHDFAYTDPLTGLASRRWLDLELSNLRDTELSLLLIDFDGLKSVNDSLGYERGDVLIAAVGSTLAAHVQVGELVARLGGDEFVVVLPDTVKWKAQARAEELTRILDRLDLPPDIEPLFQGASIGAATASPFEDPRLALRRAAEEMHSRKRRRKSDRDKSGRRKRRDRKR
jgi:diguanylate cyclase (GGDEF)-like protein